MKDYVSVITHFITVMGIVDIKHRLVSVRDRMRQNLAYLPVITYVFINLNQLLNQQRLSNLDLCMHVVVLLTKLIHLVLLDQTISSNLTFH